MAIRTLPIISALSVGLLGVPIGAAAAETLKVGVIAPLTGAGAQWGMAAAEAVKIAASGANARGGIDIAGTKYEVEVIAYDDQYKAADALAAYNRLVNQDEAKYIVVSTSPATLALAPNVENDGVLMLSSAGVEKAVDPNSGYIIRILSILRDYVPPMIAWVKDNTDTKSVVILNPNDKSGWYSTQVSEAAYKANGFDVMSTEVFERSQKDFQPLLTKVVAMHPDIIELASCPPATAGLIVRQARELGYKGLFVKDAGAATKEIIETAGKEGAEGLISLHYANPSSQGYQGVAAQYKEQVGHAPDDLFIAYYDATNILFAAMEKAGEIEQPAKVAAAVPEVLPWKGVQGDELTIGGHGGPGDDNQIMTYSYISVVKDGAPVIVDKVK